MQQMSNALMDRLLQALEHLFDYEDREEAVQQVRSSLSTCIKAALQIRSISLTSPYSFESLWFPTGSPLRREQMEWAYEESGVNVSTMRISLCPGLFAYEKEESMVQHDGWIKTERLEREPKFTIKAVVLP